MTIVKEDGGRTNMYAVEPRMYVDPQIEQQLQEDNFVNHNQNAELLNGRMAMLGIMAALGAYALTGQVIPGIW